MSFYDCYLLLIILAIKDIKKHTCLFVYLTFLKLGFSYFYCHIFYVNFDGKFFNAIVQFHMLAGIIIISSGSGSG